jgi:hypothetical protein
MLMALSFPRPATALSYSATNFSKVASSQMYSLANENSHSSMLTVALLQIAVHFMKSLASFSAVFSGMFYSIYLLNLL